MLFFPAVTRYLRKCHKEPRFIFTHFYSLRYTWFPASLLSAAGGTVHHRRNMCWESDHRRQPASRQRMEECLCNNIFYQLCPTYLKGLQSTNSQ